MYCFRFRLNEKGFDLAKEMNLVVGDDNVLSKEDWELLQSVVK